MKIQKKIIRMPKRDYIQYSITITPKYVKALKLGDKDLTGDINNKGRLELVEK